MFFLIVSVHPYSKIKHLNLIKRLQSQDKIRRCSCKSLLPHLVHQIFSVHLSQHTQSSRFSHSNMVKLMYRKLQIPSLTFSPHEPLPLNPDCLTGILIRVHYNPHITGLYNRLLYMLHTPKIAGVFHSSHDLKNS